MGAPFIDDALVQRAKSALIAAGLKVIEHDMVVRQQRRSAGRIQENENPTDANRCGRPIFWDMGLGGSPDWCDSRLLCNRQRLAIVDAPRLSRLATGWGIWCCTEVCSKSVLRTNFVYGSLEEQETVGKIVSYARAIPSEKLS